MEENQQQDTPPQIVEEVENTLNYKRLLVEILSYLSFLVVVAYIMGLDAKIPKFHIRQGIVLFSAEIIVMIAQNIIPLFFMFSWIFHVVFLILSIIGILNVLKNKEAELPFIGSFSKHIPL